MSTCHTKHIPLLDPKRFSQEFGALLIEVTYSWPGIAFRLQEAIGQRDYPLVQGIVVVVAALVVMVTVAVDLVVALLDPRIRF